jgi:hypothetical protein
MKSLKRIASWLFFFGIATFLFMLMLGLIIRSDWLADNSWFALLACAAVVVIVLLYLFIRWFFAWPHFRRVLFVLAGFIALIIFFYAEEDFRGWYAWHQFKQQEEAKGENFNHLSFAPPSVPDAQNFALTPIVASSYNWLLDTNGKRLNPPKTNYINRLWMSREGYFYELNESLTNYADWQKGMPTDFEEWQNYYRVLATKTNDFPVSQMPQSPAADVLLALSKYDSDIEKIRKASALPYSRFPLNYNTDDPFEILLPHLAALKGCCQVLQLRACAELENNQSDKALNDVKLMLRLADSIQSEPLLISHLVRIALTSVALQPVWEGQIKHKWSDAQFAELERVLAPLNFLNNYGFTMRNERAGAILEIDSMRKERDYKKFEMYFSSMRGFADEDEPSIEYSQPSKIGEFLCCPFGLYLMPDGWYYRNELTVGEMFQRCFLPMIDTNLQVGLPKVRNDANKYFKELNLGPWNLLALDSVGLRSDGRKFAYGQNSINMARVACALERYRLAHNEYPETLEALAPQFIAQIPHDVIGGKPLHYSRKDGGKFLLYSIGWNETDDGGQIGLSKYGYTDTTKGDWVWPNP